MLPRLLLRSRALLRVQAVTGKNVAPRRTLVAAPRVGETLMERRPDRALPEISQPGMRWVRTVPIFLAILVSCTLGIFNYQKSSSSVVASTLYALRTSPKAREHLGDEIYFASQMPWIWGEMNQLHGRINIQFEVKGTKAQGTMRFVSSRKGGRQGVFETTEWSLEKSEKDGGGKIDLLDDQDPFKLISVDPEETKTVGRGSYRPNTYT